MNKEEKERIIVTIAQDIRNVLFPKSVYNNRDLIARIKEQLPIEILYTDYDDVDGYLSWDKLNNVPQIVLSRKNNNYPGRQIFTVAHELGHLFLHWKWYPGKTIKLKTNNNILNADTDVYSIMYRGKSYGSSEQEADEFAGNLLMPVDKVNKVFSGLNENAKNNLDIAKSDIAAEFGVSSSAAYVRLKNLKNEGLLKKDEVK